MTWREYHNATKHTPESLRRRTHRLDWANMPDPFRHYEGTPVLDLPADPPPPKAPALEVLSGVAGEPNPQTGPEFLSQLLYYSAAISATKVVPSTGYRYALRVNPSSGNLHPTEFHFCTTGVEGWPDGLHHYRPSSHMAEQRATGAFAARLHPTAPVVFVLTSIAWREAWKYQDRAYRYCLLDIGHAWQSLALAARAIGCRAAATAVFSDNSITTLCHLPPDEWPMLIVAVSGSGIRLRQPEVDGLDGVAGQPNVLSERQVLYPSIEAVHTATSLPEGTAIGQFDIALHGKAASRGGRPFGEVVRGRRSALDFIAGRGEMPRNRLLDILRVSTPEVIDLYVYVHRVTELVPGLYIYSAAADRLDLIRAGDQRVIAAALSLQQELAGNACVAISMVANLKQLTAEHGPRGYRYAHFEAGAIGQRMYVAAESVGLRATGMGAFFDEEVSRYLNLSPAEGEVVYHFAIGYPVHDARLDALA